MRRFLTQPTYSPLHLLAWITVSFLFRAGFWIEGMAVWILIAVSHPAGDNQETGK